MRILDEQGRTVTDLMKTSGQRSPQGNRLPFSPHITCVHSSKIPNEKQLMDTMFIVGGWTPTVTSCAVERFYPFYNEWRTMAPMLKRCGDVAVCSLGGLIFTVGGRNDITSVSSVEKYDPKTNQWSSEVASLSSPRSGVCVVEMDGFMYALGGFDGTVCTNIVERYDPVLNTWTKMAPMLQHRSGAAAAVLDGFLYVMGGTDGHIPLNSVERFNPLEGTWHPCPPMRSARENPGCAVYLRRIYVAGDRDELLLELSTAEKFDPDNLKWTLVKHMKHKRFKALWRFHWQCLTGRCRQSEAQMGYQLLHQLRLITLTQTLGDTLDV
ncbi:kelch-like protein 20 isoform X2 [Megalobrama amblycephala]|uniref:kelch-like protein 20 isoform X2 n=1 Tax=Megalobrama amblycephala TaxID=75352 RepID=UPI002013EB00|nr:kelch-like protein 20 isoform X2 [Megalobrama amblycephala]